MHPQWKIASISNSVQTKAHCTAKLKLNESKRITSVSKWNNDTGRKQPINYFIIQTIYQLKDGQVLLPPQVLWDTGYCWKSVIRVHNNVYKWICHGWQKCWNTTTTTKYEKFENVMKSLEILKNFCLLDPLGTNLTPIHHNGNMVLWWYTCKNVNWLSFLRKMKKKLSENSMHFEK